MTETILIRLGSQHQDRIHWLIWAESNSEIIASGELSSAAELATLTEKAQSRRVVVLVPGCDVAIKRLTVPSKSQKALKLAAPYMLEDELAQDVDDLFFAYSGQKSDAEGHNCFLAAVERSQMQQWLQWLADANITTKLMLPDVLAMPLNSNGVSVVILGEQLIVRTGEWQGINVDQSYWQSALTNIGQQLPATEENQATIQVYSPLPFESNELQLEAMPEELPLALFADQLKLNRFNLLQDEFQVKETRSPMLTHWYRAAIVAAIALTLNFAMKGAQIIQIGQQQDAVEQEIIAVYKKAFPNTKRVRINTIRSQLKRKLQGVGTANEDSGFLPLLAKVQPAFVSVPELKPESIKFDAKRQELRMQASAKDYQSFDKFKSEVEKMRLTVNQGSQRNQGDMVSGSLSITARGGR